MSSISQPSDSSRQNYSSYPQCVRICVNRTCRKQGAKSVLAAFEVSTVPGITVMGSGCLGQCGNGPMVLVLPDVTWYCAVHPSQVPLVIEKHLLGGEKVEQMLYRRFHNREQC
ncbi:(2Fe-2S) ferredoxin domain-containing protein [Mastigocoleus testarum]|uniref:2Fe-2S ferredoxin n=1 Tax=Mastigocoleus testarum BC008 TaxID=371196 RepID=A0A0V7ZFN7_9CYAN|nr:(2Fe-2S) ferredoxin domain-containing protein [Mastigocoleus testarum]KST63250.1 2Fe-2S ferredoxin [Mastigocoleus testarum BC008]